MLKLKKVEIKVKSIELIVTYCQEINALLKNEMENHFSCLELRIPTRAALTTKPELFKIEFKAHQIQFRLMSFNFRTSN